MPNATAYAVGTKKGETKVVLSEKRSILGIKVCSSSEQQAAIMIEERLVARKPTKIAFANANLLNMAVEQKPLHQILQDFLVLNDGLGVNIASRVISGESFTHNLNGTDFVPYFLDRCQNSMDIFLLGATDQVLNKTRQVFEKRWPQHRVVGAQHGYYSESEFEQIKQNISALQPHIVLIAMGNGRQETVAAELVVPGGATSAWCIGALFDFLSGQVPRAPTWVRKIGAEWLFRLVTEPQRLWRRYIIGNPLFLLRVIRHQWTH